MKKENVSLTITQEMEYFKEMLLLRLRKKNYNFEPLKTTFYLSSPITLTHPWMHFDGLVGHLMMIRALGEDYYLLPRKFPMSRLVKNEEMNFPIKNTDGLYHSSVSFFDVSRNYLEIMYKKFEDRWAGGKKKVSKGMGYFRDYMIQHVYIPTKTVTFYVCGDFSELASLCALVTSLGDNTRLGWGRVKNFQIQKIKDDISIVKDGIAMRPIPVSFLKESSDEVALAWKPPYWDPENVAICAPPWARVKIKNG